MHVLVGKLQARAMLISKITAASSLANRCGNVTVSSIWESSLGCVGGRGTNVLSDGKTAGESRFMHSEVFEGGFACDILLRSLR
jgi:hypothetical protein